MGEQFFQVKVNNVPKETLEYVVARYDEDSQQLWFWGTWDDKNEAEKVVNDVENGILLRRI